MSVTQIFKGSQEHAAQHRHGVQHQPEPPTPRTIERRLAAIEQLIETDSGKSVLELLAEAQKRRAKADEQVATEEESAMTAQGEAAKE